MLRRDRQIKMQVFQLVDACLFALSFWVAYWLRSDPRMIYHFGLRPFGHDPQLSFDKLVWIYPVLVFVSPLVLEGQGFYSRSLLSSRQAKYWQLMKSCCIMVLVLVIAMFFSKDLQSVARWIPLWFGAISFFLVVLREEIITFASRTKMAGSRGSRHFVLIGNNEETARMRDEITGRPEESIKIVASLSLNETTISKLVELLHEYSVNGVILSAKHAYFEHVEQAIRACELEGVEAWLVADFFKTQISRTSFDDFYG